MAEIVEVEVSKGLTKQKNEREWLKVEYTLKAIVSGDVNETRTRLENLVDVWLQRAFQRDEQTGGESLSGEVLKWVPAEGPGGAYEKSVDVDNPAFKSLLKELDEHGGKLTKDGYFYWSFKNGTAIGRKKKQ